MLLRLAVQHHHRNPGIDIVPLEFEAKVNSVHPGRTDVHEDQVRPVLLQFDHGR